jgi:hypothetical protein
VASLRITTRKFGYNLITLSHDSIPSTFAFYPPPHPKFKSKSLSNLSHTATVLDLLSSPVTTVHSHSYLSFYTGSQ